MGFFLRHGKLDAIKSEEVAFGAGRILAFRREPFFEKAAEGAGLLITAV
jgi:hypothetical protein